MSISWTESVVLLDYLRELSNIQIRLSFRFDKNNECVFSIKDLDIHGD